MEGVTGKGTDTGTERYGYFGQNRTGNRESEGPALAGRAAEEEGKSHTSVGDVQEYWGLYVGEGSDTIWNLQNL